MLTCLIADFASFAPLKGAVIVDATVDETETGANGTLRSVPVESPWSARLLVNRLQAEGLAAQYRPVRPLDGPGSGLFRTFAALPETDDAVAEFASKNGRLGVASVRAHTADGHFVYGEVLDQWLRERRTLADAVALWDLLRDDDLSALQEFVAERPRSRYWSSPVRNWTGDTVQQGWQLMSDLLDTASMYQRVSRIAMMPTQDRPLAPQVVSDTLLGAMWTQLMFSNGKDYRTCPVCNRYFERSPGVARADRIYCDDVCRARAYRARKEGN